MGWELCTLDKDDEEHCTIRTVKYGKLCAAVPRRFVRRKSMFLHCPRPLTLQQLVGSHLNTVHDLRVLHTMAVLARDLASDDPTSMSPSELFVFETIKLDSLNNAGPSRAPLLCSVIAAITVQRQPELLVNRPASVTCRST